MPPHTHTHKKTGWGGGENAANLDGGRAHSEPALGQRQGRLGDPRKEKLAPARLVPEQVGFREATSDLRNGLVKIPAPGPPPARPRPHHPNNNSPGPAQKRKAAMKTPSPPRVRHRGAGATLSPAASPGVARVRGGRPGPKETPGGDRGHPRRSRAPPPRSRDPGCHLLGP